MQQDIVERIGVYFEVFLSSSLSAKKFDVEKSYNYEI